MAEITYIEQSTGNELKTLKYNFEETPPGVIVVPCFGKIETFGEAKYRVVNDPEMDCIGNMIIELKRVR